MVFFVHGTLNDDFWNSCCFSNSWVKTGMQNSACGAKSSSFTLVGVCVYCPNDVYRFCSALTHFGDGKVRIDAARRRKMRNFCIRNVVDRRSTGQHPFFVRGRSSLMSDLFWLLVTRRRFLFDCTYDGDKLRSNKFIAFI